MNARERGFLLLTSHLGDPERKPLTTAQVRVLAERVRGMEAPSEERELEARDLAALGYGPEMAERILTLLEGEALLDHYLRRGRKLGCVPIPRGAERYPRRLRRKLGPDSPGCLWAKGDLSLLDAPAVALVGSRNLTDPNREFAEETGRQAARQGFVLVSGNARGADRAAQDACLASGGRVISVVADELAKQPLQERVLYVSEDGFDEAFSAQRALSRNRVIHALGEVTFAAQCGCQHGGTWDGTVKNLRFGWSQVFGFRDGSPAMALLEQMGAELISTDGLTDIHALTEIEDNFLDR